MSVEPIRSRPALAAARALLQSADLPTTDLTEVHMTDFFYAGREEDLAGLIGVEFCGPHALLRSLVVAPAHRFAGLGAALVEHAEAYARSRGARSIFLLTTTAEAFFRRRGYVVAARAGAPAEIKASREFADICPANSAFLTKPL
jgi:amino-acid N-acetyltransferase